jgi:hypothetical protein
MVYYPLTTLMLADIRKMRRFRPSGGYWVNGEQWAIQIYYAAQSPKDWRKRCSYRRNLLLEVDAHSRWATTFSTGLVSVRRCDVRLNSNAGPSLHSG